MLLKTISNYYWVISNTLKIILEEISIKRNKIGHTSQPTTLAETSSSLRGQAGSWTPGNTAPPRSLSSLSKSPTAPPLLFTIPLVEAYRPIRSQVSVLNQVNYPTQLPPAPPSIIPSAIPLLVTWSWPTHQPEASHTPEARLASEPQDLQARSKVTQVHSQKLSPKLGQQSSDGPEAIQAITSQAPRVGQDPLLNHRPWDPEEQRGNRR